MITPVVLVSWGEFFDRLTILEIKSERLSSAKARANVLREIALLPEHRPAAFGLEIASLVNELRVVNRLLWDAENGIRAAAAAEDWQGFLRHARSIPVHNDERAQIKRQINIALSSEIVEEKQHGG